MQPSAASCYRYAVLRYVYDARRDLAVPAGVVVWGQGEPRARFRVIADDESVQELSGHDASFYLAETVDCLKEWIRDGKLPFTDAGISPDSDEWWLAAKRILHHRVRLSSPMPLECVDPETETDLLFDAVVDAAQPVGRRRHKIISAIDESLGPDLSRVFQKRARTAGYQHGETVVNRLYETARDRVVIEAINLASPKKAQQDTYQLVGKAEWITDADKGARLIVGYLSSPGGLNGEGIYKSWIEKRLQTKCYDLVHEREGFRLAVQELVDALGPQPSLPSK